MICTAIITAQTLMHHIVKFAWEQQLSNNSNCKKIPGWKKGSYELSLAKLLYSSELVSAWPNGVESHLQHEGSPSTQKLALIKILIFHLYFGIHFYTDCSVCALQQKVCNPDISIKIHFFSNKMWHTKDSHSWEQGRSSLWVQGAIWVPPGQLCDESAKIPQGPLNFWPWPWACPVYMISDRGHPRWHHKSRDCDKANKVGTNRSLQPFPDILQLCCWLQWNNQCGQMSRLPLSHL